MQDRRGPKHPQPSRIQRQMRLERQDDIAEGKEYRIEDNQRGRILFPRLIAAINAPFKPAQESRRLVMPIHNLGHVRAQEKRQYRGGHEL